jgi:hypothetical protein
MAKSGLLPAVSHAKTSASQAREQALPEVGLVFGLNIGELLGTYDRDLQSWKMSQHSLFEDLTLCLDRFPKSGIMLNGRIYEQATWVRRTEERESGLWLTPTIIQIGNRSDEGMERKIKKRLATGRTTTPPGTLLEQITLGCSAKDVKQKMYPTPRVCQGETTQGWGLAELIEGKEQVKKMWPTPDANMGIRGTQPEWKPIRNSGHTASYTLNQAVRDSYPTPQSRDWKGKSQRGTVEGNRDCLPNIVDGTLNPQFVEWLMGYPLAWTDTRGELQLNLTRKSTDLKDLEIQLFLK